MSVLTDLRGLNRSQWSAVTASLLGWTLDAFDFFLMVFMFSAIAKEFRTDVASVAIAATLTLAARPFGALVFGLLADRFGRRPVLMVDILLYSVIEFASAFAPNLTILLILRALFGFAMGGEWGVGASLTLESIPAGARGFISGLLQEGYAMGYLLASLVFAFLFDRIGWRGMFMIGVAPALLVVLLRLGVKESPAFAAHHQARQEAQALKGGKPRLGGLGLALLSLAALAVAIAPALAGALNSQAMLWWVYGVDAPLALAGLWVFRSHWRTALFAVALMTAFNFFSHGAQDLYPTFLGKQHHLNTTTVGLLTVIGNLGAIIGGLGFGALSERLGRRWTIVIAALLSLAVIPLWAFSRTLALLAAGAFLIQVMVQGAWGVVPAHLNELSPPNQRGAFPGYVYQLGNLLASGCVVWQSRIAETHRGDYGLALAMVVSVVAFVIAGLTLLGPERRGADFAASA